MKPLAKIIDWLIADRGILAFPAVLFAWLAYTQHGVLSPDGYLIAATVCAVGMFRR